MSWFLASAWMKMGHGPGAETTVTAVYAAEATCESNCQTNGQTWTMECKTLKPGLRADCVDYCGRKEKTGTERCAVKSLDESFATRLL